MFEILKHKHDQISIFNNEGSFQILYLKVLSQKVHTFSLYFILCNVWRALINDRSYNYKLELGWFVGY